MGIDMQIFHISSRLHVASTQASQAAFLMKLNFRFHHQSSVSHQKERRRWFF